MVRNVLSVAHNKGINEIIHTIIGTHYRVIDAADVFSAARRLRHQPDLQMIIIDIDDRTKEAVDFIQHISSSKFYRKPVIVICNSFNKQVYGQVLSSCVHTLFAKPFDPLDLLKSIKKYTEPLPDFNID